MEKIHRPALQHSQSFIKPVVAMCGGTNGRIQADVQTVLSIIVN